MVDSTAGERLGRFIGDGPQARMSVRAFAQAMKAREPRPRGSTRAMIHRYLAGAVPPSDFIEAAADVLGLNPAWLAFGEGEADESRSVERFLMGLMDEGRRIAEANAERLARAFGAPVPVRARAAFWRCCTHLGATSWENEEPDPVTRDVGRALRAPLEALSYDPADVSEDALIDYIELTTRAIRDLATATKGDRRA